MQKAFANHRQKPARAEIRDRFVRVEAARDRYGKPRTVGARLNQLRRLIEYKRTTSGSRAPRKAQAEDHLAIIAAIERGDYLTAASLVRNHLEDPKRESAERFQRPKEAGGVIVGNGRKN